MNSAHVRLGIPLPGNIYDESGHLLLSKGYVAESQEQIDHLLSRGMYVEISVFEAHFRALSAEEAPVVENRFDPFLSRNTLKISLNRILRGILDGSATVEQIFSFSDQLMSFAETDAEAAIASCLLDHHEETYVVAHSLSTAIFCALLSGRLEWQRERRRSTMCASLTMNVGMFELQQRLLRQATPLPPSLLEQVHAHPDVSVNMLNKIGVADPLWLAVVHQHHEKPGGTGYPGRLTEPVTESQLVRILDAFGARTMARADRRPAVPAQVMRSLFAEEGQGPCAPLVAVLVKGIGLYPPGSFVKLENNEIAVVFRANSEENSQAVAAVTTTAGTPTMQPVRRDTHRKGLSIASTVAYDKVSVGYDLGKLWISRQRA